MPAQENIEEKKLVAGKIKIPKKRSVIFNSL
jgi:hypothetical protein